MELWEKPQRSRLILGFPGFGMIGTITTEFLMEHLETRQIGRILLKGLPSTLAIHNGEVLDPIGVYYNEKYNIVIIRGIAAFPKMEWDIVEEINKIIDELDPYEAIDIEGVSSQNQNDDVKIYYYSNVDEKKQKFNNIGLKELKDGIILGVTSIILLKVKRDLSVLFAETHSELPDSKSAAKVIEVLDKYLGLEIDYKPLLEQAKIFEQKLKNILQKSTLAQKEADKKTMSYVG